MECFLHQELYLSILRQIHWLREMSLYRQDSDRNLKNLIEASGSSMDKVVKTTVFIKDMNDFGKINDIYKDFFTSDFPARSCVEVARLPKDVLIEIEAIATVE